MPSYFLRKTAMQKAGNLLGKYKNLRTSGDFISGPRTPLAFQHLGNAVLLAYCIIGCHAQSPVRLC